MKKLHRTVSQTGWSEVIDYGAASDIYDKGGVSCR